MRTHIRTSDCAYASEWTNQTNRWANQTSEWIERTEWIWPIVLLNELNRFVNQVISSESNNRIQIILNQTNHHIGYSAITNDDTKPHRICTSQKRYRKQPITHEPTASDERTNNYGLDEQHQVNFFRIRWTTMRAWTTTDLIGWNKQITLSERWQILWMTNESRNNKQRHPIYKPKSNSQTWIERLCKLKSAMSKPKANNIRFGKRTSEFSPTASDLLKANQEQKQIGKSTKHWTEYLR